jgi:hypothetical protein
MNMHLLQSIPVLALQPEASVVLVEEAVGAQAVLVPQP